MPTYLFKWPEESVWLALGTAVAVLVGVVLAERGASAALVAAASGLIGPLVRFVYGLVSPTPTVAEVVTEAREAMDDKPGGA